MKKYKQVLILLNIENRERMIAEIMSEQLRSKNLAEEVVIGQAYEIIFHIYDYQPDLVISSLPRDEYSIAMYTMVKFVFQCLWVVIHPEGFIPMTEEVINELVGFNDVPVNLMDMVLFWGPGMAEEIGKRLVERKRLSAKDRIGVFGYLLYERQCLDQLEKPAIVEEIRRKSEHFKKTVLFVTACVLDYIDDRWSENMKKRARSNLYYMEKYRELIRELARRNPDVLFVIKMHPVEIERSQKDNYEEVKLLENVCIIDIVTQISFFFDTASLLIHYGSTTALEAYAYHIPNIGLINDHIDVTANSLGRKDLLADELFSIQDIDGVDRFINQSSIMVRKNTRIEDALYKYMNFEMDRPYQPSVKLLDYLGSLRNPQRINYSDPYVKEALTYKAAIKRRWCFRGSMVKEYIKGNRSKAERIHQWLKKYSERTRERG